MKFPPDSVPILGAQPMQQPDPSLMKEAIWVNGAGITIDSDGTARLVLVETVGAFGVPRVVVRMPVGLALKDLPEMLEKQRRMLEETRQ